MGFKPQASRYCRLSHFPYCSGAAPLAPVASSSAFPLWQRWVLTRLLAAATFWAGSGGGTGLVLPAATVFSSSLSAAGAREAWASCRPLMEGAASLPDLPSCSSYASTATCACCYPFPFELANVSVKPWMDNAPRWLALEGWMDSTLRWLALEGWKPGSAAISSHWSPMMGAARAGQPQAPEVLLFLCVVK